MVENCRVRCCWLFAILLLCSVACFGQSGTPPATGTPPFASSGGGVADVVDLANLNAHFSIPVVNKAGRGTPLRYNLSYNSSVWYPVTSGGTTSWQPANTWGWGSDTSAAIGYISYATQSTLCYTGRNPTGGTTRLNNWVYYDSNNTPHPFNGSTLLEWGTCGSAQNGLTVGASDGSGYTLSTTFNGSTATVTARGGSVVSPPINSSSGAGTITDRNGNQISVNSSEVFTDTLGQTALTIAGSGTPSSPTTFTYPAPSGNAEYSMKYTSYTIKTNFGCSGITEYTASNVPLVSEIDLPDGTNYKFTYEATPSFSGDVTGRLASVTIPAGGTISYAYSGGSNGITCGDGSTATLTRTTPDGTWIYAHSESGAAWTTLVTDPQGNQTNVEFQGIYETERQVYQGSTSGTLLKTIYTCYNGATAPCNTTAITLPIAQKNVYTKWPGSAGLESETAWDYNGYGLFTETDQFAYGSGSPGPIVRKTLITYASLSNNIVDRPATVTIEDGSSNIKSQTTYTYDQGTPTATSGTPQHIAVSGSRGNVTTISSLVSGTTTLNENFTYYDTGMIQTATDINGAVATYTYGATSCGNSFPTSVAEPMSLSRSMTWNCFGGVETSATDENGKTTTVDYTNADFWRPDSATDPASNATTFSYSNATSIESSMPFNGGSSTSDVLTTLDSLGRSHLTQQKEGPSLSNYDSIESDYDSIGHTTKASLPYSGTAGQTDSSAPGNSITYDALGRKLTVTHSGGKDTTFTYAQNDTYRTLGPAPSGENAKRRQYEYDSLGRMTSVCEIASATGSGSCGQTTPVTGYWTQYGYDVLNDLTGVTQNAQSSSQKQTRTYSYDGLDRLTSETNPESGTTAYTYDTDTTCGTSHGDLVKKVDAVGNVTCYAYDALHRVTSVYVSSGTYAASTPYKYFIYDSTTVNGVAMANVKGRLAEAYTSASSCPSPCASKITDEGLSYTARGETSDLYESTPHSSGYYHLSQTYWANGAPDVLSGLTGLPTITYNVDGEGRVNSASASSGQNPLASTTYNVTSQATQVNLGSSDSDAFTYDQNTNRLTKYTFNVNGQSVVGQLSWNSIGTLASLAITDPFNGPDNQTCNYTHDDLSRIASVNCGSPWAQLFTYDAFGNISKSGTQSFQPTYSYLTNQMTQIGSSTPTYDANGNVTNDFLHTYSWDAAGRPVTIDGVGVTYDALGRMVEQNKSGGTYSQIVYTPSGAKLALMNGQSLSKAFVPLTGGSMAVYNSSGLAYYRHSDWLGSSRLASTPARAMYSDGAYAPFGEAYAQSGTADLSFTGMNQDTVANLYDFPAREYGTQGRWPSPDPAGITSVYRTDPQTWNRYAYVRNTPLQLFDTSGMVIPPPLMAGGGGGGGGFLSWLNNMLMMSEEGLMSEGAYGGGLGCMADGVDASCGMVMSMLGSGGAVQCPNNNCNNFEAFADGSSGYVSPSAPPGFSVKDIANALAEVSAAGQGQPIDPNQLTGQALNVYKLLLQLGVSAENISIYQTGTQSFAAVLTDAGFDQLEQSPLFASHLGDSFLHYPYTDGGRSDQTPSLHGVWFDEDVTGYVGGTGIYMQFHSDSSNPYDGGFWQHWGCDVLHLSCN